MVRHYNDKEGSYRRMFVKILRKESKSGEMHYYASLVETKRVNGQVKQYVKANLGPVTEEQIPYLKAAYAKNKPKLVYDEETKKQE